MNVRPLLALAVLGLAGVSGASGIDLRQRSESGTKQFVVYSEDVRLRQRVASFAEEVKREVLQLLNESDLWRAPVVITLAPATTLERGEPPARLRLAETQPGFKIEIQVKIGDDPAAVHLQKLLLRAVLLEYAYREPGIAGGEAVVEPPWWIIEGMIEMARRRAAGGESGLFQRLIETNRLPAIESFLAEKPDELGPTASAVDRVLAMALLELLLEQPGGREGLARLLRDWPQSNGDPVALLTRHFPVLGEGRLTLQKWWMLSLARFGAADRHQGLSAEATDKALAPLLEFEIVTNKAGGKERFAVEEFDRYLKLPASRAVLGERRAEIIALSTRANALYRPVMADFEQIFALLARGKSRGVRARLAKAEEYRQRVLRRTVHIADYLNWFEATQSTSRSSAFDAYLKTAEEISERDRKQTGPVGRYLDEVERDF